MLLSTEAPYVQSFHKVEILDKEYYNLCTILCIYVYIHIYIYI